MAARRPAPRRVVSDGRIVAPTDWVDQYGGAEARDLAALWRLFDVEQHAGFCTARHPVDDAAWTRSPGWAALVGPMVRHVAKPDDPTARDQTAAAPGRGLSSVPSRRARRGSGQAAAHHDEQLPEGDDADTERCVRAE